MLVDHVTKRPGLYFQFQPGMLMATCVPIYSAAPAECLRGLDAGLGFGDGQEGRCMHEVPEGQDGMVWARAEIGEAPQRMRQTECSHSPRLVLHPNSQGHGVRRWGLGEVMGSCAS